MRLGTRRGVVLAIALAAVATAGNAARANDLFHHTIPTEVEAVDVNTGQPYYAPPIPYGHYAKGGMLGRVCGCIASPFHALGGLGHGLCGKCGGKGCGDCGGSGLCGGGGNGNGNGNGFGHGSGFGHGNGCGHGAGDPNCGGGGCGLLGGNGLGHGKRFNGCGLCGGQGCGVCSRSILASSQAVPGIATTATPLPSGQAADACGLKGCGLKGRHKHHGGGGGGLCNHDPRSSCGNCLGMGNGNGNGNGRGCMHGPGATCDNCAGGNGNGGNGCRACGGRGCGLCSKGLIRGCIYGLLHPHAGKIEYFVGPGGPVPITPGYVPYVVTTRSPRDYFAFPPFTQ